MSLFNKEKYSCKCCKESACYIKYRYRHCSGLRKHCIAKAPSLKLISAKSRTCGKNCVATAAYYMNRVSIPAPALNLLRLYGSLPRSIILPEGHNSVTKQQKITRFAKLFFASRWFAILKPVSRLQVLDYVHLSVAKKTGRFDLSFYHHSLLSEMIIIPAL